MRIMQLYRIESDYKNHKKRLDSIRKANSKEKIARITSQQFYLANEHKKLKINAEIFHEKEELSRRQHSNHLMHQTISDHAKRRALPEPLPLPNPLPNPHRHPSLETSKIESQNVFLRQKIDKMKSVYHTYRKNSETNDPTRPERQRSKRTDKEKLMNLLKTQFKLEPTVVFPRSKTRTVQQEEGELRLGLGLLEEESVVQGEP